MCGFIVLEGDFDSNFHSPTLGSFNHITNTLTHRGPDDHKVVAFPRGLIGFHRLAIMDLSASGAQPFKSNSGNLLVCNGEIYNYPTLKLECAPYVFISHSDCEVLLPLYEKWGIKKLVSMLDAEFALVIWDQSKEKIIAARDPMGIRPLFYGTTKDNKLAFASEVKALKDCCTEIKPFPPGYFFDGEKFECYLDLAMTNGFHTDGVESIKKNINALLRDGVKKRLQSDAEVGFLLSGGLDSSLVCAIAQEMSSKPIRTFSIGMTDDAIDSKYAKDVADYIGANHTNITMTVSDVMNALKDVIYHLETWDITTIRASVGMYLVCKAIKESTNIKVLLTGEVSDELFGYKYTDFAPSPEEFQKEAAKRIRELYLYDVLRADRSISAHSLEARVPFSDKFFVEYVMHINPTHKMNTTGMGKFLLRESFKAKEGEKKLLPDHILWRDKAAFSDAVGHSMVDELKSAAEKMYSESEFEAKKKKYAYKTPFTKESLMYREIFEGFYPGREALIPDYWMPNQSWENCKVSDPSARVLPNYGASGK